MVKYIKSSDGKFAGSIGVGKNHIPTVGTVPLSGVGRTEKLVRPVDLSLEERITSTLHSISDNIVDEGNRSERGRQKAWAGRRKLDIRNVVTSWEAKTPDEILLRTILANKVESLSIGPSKRSMKKYLRSVEKITDQDFYRAFGPQWPEFVSFYYSTRNVTNEQLKLMEAMRPKKWRGDRWQEGWVISEDSYRYNEWHNAWWATSYVTSTGKSEGFGREVAAALVARDRIGEYGYTQKQYDVLTGPWRTIIGPIHAGDVNLKPKKLK